MKLSVPDFSDLLKGAKHSAVHLEMRDTYGVGSEKEKIAAWKAGHRLDPDDRASWWRPWLDLISETVERGVVIRRCRIVSEPVSEYTRWLHSGTFTNTAAGEQVRWLPRHRTMDIALPGVDFWLFDGETVLFNHFTGEGAWADPARTYTDEAAAVKLAGSAFEAAWERAIPHEQFTV
ncbi:hypothetical protein P3T37_001613 [Kitasatospora sp. MAA4]|uniref:DUF6879 family protein n=1 Tax=Kitasatospora sp. MAA4 TaxID=3035093 RepID=UPI002476E4F6|nr:DUF6879 family protein [Kitasatospora sp. MAA4]MDH6132228.1 hypothetical protein [Kitasatospora sp. MAA4]